MAFARSNIFWSADDGLCATVDGHTRWLATVLFDSGPGEALVHMADGRDVRVPTCQARTTAQKLALEILDGEASRAGLKKPTRPKKSEVLKRFKPTKHAVASA
jgi:hypothetical protein